MNIALNKHLKSTCVIVVFMCFRPHESSANEEKTKTFRSPLDQFQVEVAGFTKQEEVVKAEMGYRLFRDKELSANGKVSCESCHKESNSFSDTKALSMGIDQTKTNAPALINMRFQQRFFWDGRVEGLERQVLEPIENPNEHGFSRLAASYIILKKHLYIYEYGYGKFPEKLKEYLNKADSIPHGYPIKANFKLSEIDQNSSWIARFNKLTPLLQNQVNEVFRNMGDAILWYQKSIIAVDSPFDRYIKSQKGNSKAVIDGFGESEERGLILFMGKAKCISCHRGPMLRDEGFHFTNIAKTRIPGHKRGLILRSLQDIECRNQVECEKKIEEVSIAYKKDAGIQNGIKTPSLRNIALTAPYMHDGSLKSLREVIDRYNHPPYAEGQNEKIKNLNLTEAEKKDLEAFLKSLTSPIRDLSQEWTGSQNGK
jgi:cytochrome c peroxidase